MYYLFPSYSLNELHFHASKQRARKLGEGRLVIFEGMFWILIVPRHQNSFSSLSVCTSMFLASFLRVTYLSRAKLSPHNALRSIVAGGSCRSFGAAASNSMSVRTSYPFNAMDAETLRKRVQEPHPNNNIPESIIPKIGQNLHLQKHHPLHIVKHRIEEFCQKYAVTAYQQHAGSGNVLNRFEIHDALCPLVNTKNCFDDLLVKADHVSRRPSDTYYLNDELLLRTHTSAHQCPLILSGSTMFLCSGDVFRRDEIDSSHYPVFHQMEGVKIFDQTELVEDDEASLAIIKADLKGLLTGLAKHLFGDVEMRWRDDYFPFTDPSFELDVFFEGEWCKHSKHDVHFSAKFWTSSKNAHVSYTWDPWEANSIKRT